MPSWRDRAALTLVFWLQPSEPMTPDGQPPVGSSGDSEGPSAEAGESHMAPTGWAPSLAADLGMDSGWWAHRNCFCGCRPLCKRFRLVWSRDRVRSSVRPLCAAHSEAAGRYGDPRIGSKSHARASMLWQLRWFSRSGSVRSFAHSGRRLLTPPSPARGRAASPCGHAATARAGSL